MHSNMYFLDLQLPHCMNIATKIQSYRWDRKEGIFPVPSSEIDSYKLTRPLQMEYKDFHSGQDQRFAQLGLQLLITVTKKLIKNKFEESIYNNLPLGDVSPSSIKRQDILFV